MPFSHWTFRIDIATRYVGWFSLDLFISQNLWFSKNAQTPS